MFVAIQYCGDPPIQRKLVSHLAVPDLLLIYENFHTGSSKTTGRVDAGWTKCFLFITVVCIFPRVVPITLPSCSWVECTLALWGHAKEAGWLACENLPGICWGGGCLQMGWMAEGTADIYAKFQATRVKQRDALWSFHLFHAFCVFVV